MRTELSKYPTLRISETHHLSWRKSGKDRTICVLYNPITDFVYAEGSAVRKKPDAFDFVFGMKKSLISLFRNNKFERPFRKLCFDIFYDAYGEGVCKPIEIKTKRMLIHGGMSGVIRTTCSVHAK